MRNSSKDNDIVRFAHNNREMHERVECGGRFFRSQEETRVYTGLKSCPVYSWDVRISTINNGRRSIQAPPQQLSADPGVSSAEYSMSRAAEVHTYVCPAGIRRRQVRMVIDQLHDSNWKNADVSSALGMWDGRSWKGADFSIVLEAFSEAFPMLPELNVPTFTTRLWGFWTARAPSLALSRL